MIKVDRPLRPAPPTAVPRWRRRARSRKPSVPIPAATMPHSIRPPRPRTPAGRSPPRSAEAPAPPRRGTPRSRAALPQRVAPLLQKFRVELLPTEPRARRSAPPRASGKSARGFPALSAVRAFVIAVPASAMMQQQQRQWPRRRRHHLPRAQSQVLARTAACPTSRPVCRHLASSSHQAAENCGPRRLSGSSEENAIRDRAVRQLQPFAPIRSSAPVAPLPQSRLSSPDWPCTITSRTSAIVSPTSATAFYCPARLDAARKHQRADPFGAGARLPRAASAEHQPGGPVLRRRKLIGPRRAHRASPTDRPAASSGPCSR